MWFALIASAFAVDLDVTVTAPGAAPVNVSFRDVEPGPIPAALVVPWFDGKQCRIALEFYKKKGGYSIGVEVAELRVLEDGALQVVVVKEDKLKLSDEKRTRLTLELPLSDGEAAAWSLDANVSGLPKKAPTEAE